MKTRTMKTVILFATLIIVPFLSQAQGGPPGDPNDTPIDSWLAVLIVLGVLYGIKRIFETGKRTEAK